MRPQGVRQLGQVPGQRRAVVQDAAGRVMGLGDDVARVGLRAAPHVLGVGLGRGAHLGRLGLGLGDGRRLAALGLLARLRGVLVDLADALTGLGLGRGGVALGGVADLAGLGLGGLDAEVDGAVGLGDTLASLLLGLAAQVLGGALGGFDDRRDLGGGDRDLAHRPRGAQRGRERVEAVGPVVRQGLVAVDVVVHHAAMVRTRARPIRKNAVSRRGRRSGGAAAAVAWGPWPTTATTRRRSSPAGSRSGPTSARGEVSNEEPDDGAEMTYDLVMLPYPSGEPHIGHLKVYSVGDAVAHFHRRTGRRVLQPMGYDAFGLPAENHAIRTGQHPRDSTDAAIAEFQQQFRAWGISIDWSRELATHEPSYYRWTQWIFLKLFERGLAYRKEAAVKWCPNDATVLANEQVIDGRCERCGASRSRPRTWTQWFFRITDYADRARWMRPGAASSSGRSASSTMQRNWIGRSARRRASRSAVEGSGRHRVARLHDPTGHPLRGHVLCACT